MRVRRSSICGVGGRKARSLLTEDGASTVEIALSASLVLMMMIGIMQMCLALYSWSFTSMAARQGTRYAIVRGSACTAFATACPATQANIQTYVKSLVYPGIIAANIVVSATWSAYPTTATCSPSTSCNNPGNMVKVSVQYSFPLNIPFMPKSTLPIKSTSQMIISQ